MSEQGLFKTVFSGFDKKAVLQYVQDMNEKANQAQDELMQQIQTLEESKKALQDQLKQQQDQLARQEEENNLQKSKISELTSSMNTLSFRLEKQVQLTDEKDRELKIQQESNRQLKFKVESLEYKSRKYDEVALEIGETLADARHNAAQITDKAKIEVNETAEKMQTELCSFQDELKQLKRQMLESMDKIRLRLEQMEQAADSASASFTVYELSAPILESQLEDDREPEPAAEFFR